MKTKIVHVAILLLIMVGAVLAIHCAAVAKADAQDDALFLSLIAQEESLSFNDPSLAVQQGKTVCMNLAEFGIPATVRGNMIALGLDYDPALALTSIAAVVYCPWEIPNPDAKTIAT